MNDERSISGEKEMDGLHDDSEIDLELRFGEKLGDLKSKGEDLKMDGEGKKKHKKNKQVEVRVESEDDEPIGSLFKMKKVKTPKRVKSDGGKVGNVKKVRAEKVKVKEVDLGEMDDTLASLRKKLKGPKVGKDGGSGTGKGKGSAFGSNGLGLGPKQVVENPTCSGDNSSALLLGLVSVDVPKRRRKKFEGLKKGKDGGSGTEKGMGLVKERVEEAPTCSGDASLPLDLGSVGMAKRRGRKPKGSKMAKDVGSGAENRMGLDLDVGLVPKQVEESLACSADASALPLDLGLMGTAKRRGRKPKASKVGKDVGSGTEKTKSSDLSVAGLRLKQEEESPISSGGGSGLHVDVGSLDVPKRPRKRSKLASMLKKTGVPSDCGDVLDQWSGGIGSQEISTKKEKEKVTIVAESCNHSSDENLEFSLSEFIRKSNSGSVKKARSSSSRKKRKVSPDSGDGLEQSLDGASADVPHTSIAEPHSSSVLVSRVLNIELNPVSAGSLLKDPDFVKEADSELVKEAVKTQVSHKKPSQSSSWTQDSKVASSFQELAPPPDFAEDVARSIDDRCNKSLEEVSRLSRSPLPISHSGSVTDLRETPAEQKDNEWPRCNKSLEGISGDPVPASLPPVCRSGSVTDTREKPAAPMDNADEAPGNEVFSHQTCDVVSEESLFRQTQNSCSGAVQKVIPDETQNLKSGLNQCSKGEEVDVSEREEDYGLNGTCDDFSENPHPSDVLLSGEVYTSLDGVFSDRSGSQTTTTEAARLMGALDRSSAAGIPVVCPSNAIEELSDSFAMPKDETMSCFDDDKLGRKCEREYSHNYLEDDALGDGSSSQKTITETAGFMGALNQSSDADLYVVGPLNAIEEPSTSFAMPKNEMMPCVDDEQLGSKCTNYHLDNGACPSQPSENTCQEISGEKLFSVPCKIEPGDIARFDEVAAEPSEKKLDDSLIPTVHNSPPVSDPVKMGDSPRLEVAQFPDRGLENSQPQPFFSPPGLLLKKDETGTEIDSYQTLGTSVEESYTAIASKPVGEIPKSEDMLHPEFILNEAIKSAEFCSPVNQEEESIAADDISNQFSDGSLQVFPASPQSKPSDDGEGSPVPCRGHHYSKEEIMVNCSRPIHLEPTETLPDDSGKAFDLENQDTKLLPMQRVARTAKKRRHGDMAYEGDTDWDFLMQGQGLFENSRVSDEERPSRGKNKSDFSNISAEADNFGTAAVAAGLKARAAGPFEKIRFKDILKRRGGLHEYLETRNLILGLWSKDMNRILPLSDCGVTDTPSEDEPPRASLIRDIYIFLNHNGYINMGIAYEKEKSEPAKAIDKLAKQSTTKESFGTQVADSEDGVAFIFGQTKSSEKLEEKKDMLVNSDKPVLEATNSQKLPITSTGSESSALLESEDCVVYNERENEWVDIKLPNMMANLDALTNPSSEVADDGLDSLVGLEQIKDSYGFQSVAVDHFEGKDVRECNLKEQRKIIIIGAGPAGLTAARHLQRQGFSVTVLEARNRLGGRVYTDRSSLSVPVDLGASIITGVEADVATERRPDPSSLVCLQLGLELTVLNTDCPLYDTVTGQKVPADLDEALEAEYNSLLDDTLVLVAQKGERAMRMSLEDGLEYVLKKRRMSRLASNAEVDLDNSANASFGCGTNGLNRKIPNRGSSKEEILSPFERRVMNWHFANLEYGCAALLKEVSLPYWNQDDVYGGFGGAHCMIKGGYSTVIDSLGKGLNIYLNHVVTDVSYSMEESGEANERHNKVKVSTSNGNEFLGDAVLVTVPLGCLKANTIRFSPSLPEWKQSSIQQLGFGVLNKVVLQFPDVFWDDSVDYFGATAEETDRRGQCFMFWNVKKTVGAPVLIALVVGKAALDGESMTSSDHVNHALKVLRKLFGDASVPDPVASVVTNWGQDPFSRGAYSYVAVGASGEDYDILGRPVENCLFFAGEATCKEYPDTVGGAMMSGLREAVRIIDILNTGNDHTAEVEAMEAAQRQSESERNEVRDILKRLEAVELSDVLFRSSFDGDRMLTKETLLQDMFHTAKTIAGRLHLAKKLLNLPVEALKSFAGTKEGLCTLNSWILDSMGKDGTQLLRHCVRLLVLVSTNLIAVRLSGIGKTVKEKVCVHTSRDIRAVASQLVSMWIEVFRKEKAANGGLKLLRQTSASDSLKAKSSKELTSGKPLRTAQNVSHNKGNLQVPSSPKKNSLSNTNTKKMNCKPVKLETVTDSKTEVYQLHSRGTLDSKAEDNNIVMSEEEAAAFAAAETARAAAEAACAAIREAYASKEAECSVLPKIPSFHKFARREQYAQMDESDLRKRWSGGVLGRQDCLSDIDSRNCKVRNWSVDFSAACPNLDSSRMSGDNYTQQSYSNEVMYQVNPREHSGESVATDNRLTKAWVDSAGSGGVKDYHAIERWQSQAAAADSDYYHSTLHIRDEEDSNTGSKPLTRKSDKGTEESAASQAIENQELENQSRGVERIKKAVVDYVASLLMPLYKARKIDKEGYKSIMKKSATKVMEQTTDAEKVMSASEFLDFKRKNKIRAFVDKLIEKHMAMTPVDKP